MLVQPKREAQNFVLVTPHPPPASGTVLQHGVLRNRPTQSPDTVPFQHGTTTQSRTCSTSNHTLTTDEQASLLRPRSSSNHLALPFAKKPHKRSESPQSNDISTSNFLKASLPHLLTVLCTSHSPPHTQELISCSPAVKCTRLRTAVSVLP